MKRIRMLKGLIPDGKRYVVVTLTLVKVVFRLVLVVTGLAGFTRRSDVARDGLAVA